MKPQKNVVVAQKAQKTPATIAKNRRSSPEKLSTGDIKKLEIRKYSKKPERTDEIRRKSEIERKRLLQLERRKKMDDNKRKIEDKRREKVERTEENKKKGCKDSEKKLETSDEKKGEKRSENIDEESLNETINSTNDSPKKKSQKSEEKAKTEKQTLESKRIKNDKRHEDDKKKGGKLETDIPEDNQTFNSAVNEENIVNDDKTDIAKRKDKDDKKKDGKGMKMDCKENTKAPMTKEKKITEVKKSQTEKETVKKFGIATTLRKESKGKQTSQNKPTKRIVIAKKSRLPLAKKLIEKKLKLVKIGKTNEDKNPNDGEDEEENVIVASVVSAIVVKSKKKIATTNSRIKSTCPEKKPKLAKQMKVKLSEKTVKISNVLKKAKIKKITEKIVANRRKNDVKDNQDKSVNDSGNKRGTSKDENVDNPEINAIKREIFDDKNENDKSQEVGETLKIHDNKKVTKSRSRFAKKTAKKLTKVTAKSQEQSDESSDQLSTKSEDVSLEELMKKARNNEDNKRNVGNARKENDSASIDLKLEMVNVNEESGFGGEASPTSASDSEDNYVDEIESRGRGKQKNMDRRVGKERDSSPLDERARRMRLFGFWSGPKRHRVASLNALAKVHCLYENEAGGVYLGGFCKPKPENQRPKKVTGKDETKEETRKLKDKEIKERETRERETKERETKEREIKEKETREKESMRTIEKTKIPDNNKRNLRNVPGLRGKHWDMIETSSSSSSSSSSSDDEAEREKMAQRTKKRNATRRKKIEEVMDLKDMVVCKRMASLNASAILAASYSDEKNRLGSSASDTSSESEVEVIKRRKQGADNGDTENKRKSANRQGNASEEVIKPSKKVVIVNQDTDVTITGVYVNQTRSTHHEGFCSIAGMQYRISSTSHTQTAATAVAAELHEQQKPEQPCKSYTPLGALSSMQPPGSQGNHPNMSPRRHSAFSAPHQHGYYQPAGPLIQHPPTLPPVKAPPPEPTPTPPQNSEGSDDLVAASTTSGGTNSTGGGGFYRAYCPQYYGTPPQYQELCYPPTYPHPHAHPPPYYKYAPTYRRQYYGYPGADGSGGTGGAGPGVVEYQSPPQPGEYPMPPYYGAYPPPPPPLPPPPNPAYLHAQGRPIVDHAAFQGCPCPMQSCPKNVDTGPLIGNGKGAPVASGPGLSLPPSALVGPPSPARGLAGLAPPHGANAWDTDRVQLNTHRSNLNSQSQQQQKITPASSVHGIVTGAHGRAQNSECRTKNEKTCTEDKLGKCNCPKRACTSTCEVKLEALSPIEETLSSSSCRNDKATIHDFKLENNNVKCESCSIGIGQDNMSCSANCNVKCETGYKCEIIKCEQCMKEGQMTIMELEKDSGILLIDEKRLETDSSVKEELNDVIVVDTESWQKPDYEPIVQEIIDDNIIVSPVAGGNAVVAVDELPRCQKLTKRKLSLDSLSDVTKKRKVDKRTLSVGSTRDSPENERLPSDITARTESHGSFDSAVVAVVSKKSTKNDCQKRKNEPETTCPTTGDGTATIKKAKITKPPSNNGIANISAKTTATESSINETIDDVIQQSLKMSQKKKSELANDRTTEVKKKKGANLTSAIKKVARKYDHVKAAVIEKLPCLTKSEIVVAKENSAKCKVENKLGRTGRTHDTKCKSNNKVNAKITEIRSKSLETKPKVPDVRTSNSVVNGNCHSAIAKNRVIEITENVKRGALVKKKRKSTKKTTPMTAPTATTTTTTTSCMKKATTNAAGKLEASEIVIDNCSPARRPFLKPKWSNGWSWEGDSYEAKVYLTNEESAIRRCYASMKHVSGDVLRPRDCVLLKSGQRKADLPFVAKIAALWENPDDGEMMFSLLWYYRPEHTEQGRTDYDTEDEVFASRHRDANSVACIEDKCYILTFNEYCRYRKNLRRIEEGLESPGLIVPPGEQSYPRECRQPPIPVPSDMVLFCRRVYDYRGKKLVKNPG